MDWSFIIGCTASAFAGGALAFMAVAVVGVNSTQEDATETDRTNAMLADSLRDVHTTLCDLDATVNALSAEIEETQRIARDGRQILAQLAGPAPVRFAKPVPHLDAGDVRHG